MPGIDPQKALVQREAIGLRSQIRTMTTRMGDLSNLSPVDRQKLLADLKTLNQKVEELKAKSPTVKLDGGDQKIKGFIEQLQPFSPPASVGLVSSSSSSPSETRMQPASLEPKGSIFDSEKPSSSAIYSSEFSRKKNKDHAEQAFSILAASDRADRQAREAVPELTQQISAMVTRVASFSTLSLEDLAQLRADFESLCRRVNQVESRIGKFSGSSRLDDCFDQLFRAPFNASSCKKLSPSERLALFDQVIQLRLQTTAMAIKMHDLKDQDQLLSELRGLNETAQSLKIRHPGVELGGAEIKLAQYIEQLQPSSSSSHASSSSSSTEPLVEITVRCVLPEEAFLMIRGSGALNGVRMNKVSEGVYSARVSGVYPGTEYKIKLNDTTWERGENHKVRDGEASLNFPGHVGAVSAAFVSEIPVEKTTWLSVKIDLREGESIAIRGSGSVLNWGRDLPLEKVEEGLYRVQIDGIYPDTEYKFVINGRAWEEGDNHSIREGDTVLRIAGREGLISVVRGIKPTRDKVHERARRTLSSTGRSVSARFDSRFNRALSLQASQEKRRSQMAGTSSSSSSAPSGEREVFVALLLNLLEGATSPREKIEVLLRALATAQSSTPAQRAILEELAKKMYDALPADAQGKLRWHIFVANNKSTKFEGVDRGDLGKYVVENALLSPLSVKAFETYLLSISPVDPLLTNALVKMETVLRSLLPSSPASSSTPVESSSSSASLIRTAVGIACSIGPADKLFIRGTGPGLNWGKGVEMTRTPEGNYSFEADAEKDFEFKVLVNDRNWSAGPNMVAKKNQAITFTPIFEQPIQR